jgi:light-regulated signal transduction histidine kinase (bacteriophytochrome)
MRALVRDMLHYSRMTQRDIDLRTTDVAAVFRESLESLQALIEENDARVIAEPLPVVMADPLRLGQVFQTLSAMR